MKGWSFSEVLATNSGSASNDLYGKLYVHVRSILGTFRHCLLEHGVTSELLSIDAADLPAYLPKAYFARIETSNICDTYYLRTYPTISALDPLLQNQAQNPHATLLTFYIMAVYEARHAQGRQASTPIEQNLLKPYWHLLLKKCPRSVFANVEQSVFSAAGVLVRDNAHFSRRYAPSQMSLITDGSLLGTGVKVDHTIVERWPTALKLKPGQQGWEEEFATALASCAVCSQRYVEWKSVDRSSEEELMAQVEETMEEFMRLGK